MAYHLEGRLLEVCNCRVLCPCWIGEDPDFGTCDTIVAWHFDKGTIDGVDVSDRTIALIAHVPGNILQGNWRAAVYLDERVTPAAGGGDPQGLHGQGRRAGGRAREARSAKSSRWRRCRSRSRCKAAAARSSWGRGLCGARAVRERLRRDDDARRHGVLDRSRRAGVRRQGAALPVEEREARHRSRHVRPQRAAKHVRVPVLVDCRRSPSPRRRHVWRRSRRMSTVRSAPAALPPAAARRRSSGSCSVCSSSRRGPRWGCGARARTAAISSTAAGAMPARSRHCVARCRRATSWCRRCCMRRRGC